MDTQTTATESAPTRRRAIMASLKGLFFTLMVLTAMWFALRHVLTPLVFSHAENTASDIENSLEARITTLEEKIAKLEKQSPPTIDISPLEARITALENTPRTEMKESPPAIHHEEIDALKADLEKLKSADQRYLRSIILISQLQDAIRSGRPFASELSALTILRPDMKEILSPLSDASSTGIATLAHLQEQFSRTIAPALAAHSNEKSLSQNLRSLITIRKIGEAQTGNDDQSVIARAEAKLAKGDVAAALQETSTLSPHALQNFSAWQERAKRYLTAQATIAALQNQIATGAQE